MSIARKLYLTVGIMALLIAVEMLALMFAIKTLSSVRTYVGGEGLWSKAQKDAVYYLQKYSKSYDEHDYNTYLHFLKVPLGDRKARLELSKAEPDLAVARQGFLEGRLHPDDIDGAIKLVRRFYWVSYLNKALTTWGHGDTLISQLQTIGGEVHVQINKPVRDEKAIGALLDRVSVVNEALTKIEDDFSYTLGEGSRWLAGIILTLLLSIVLTVEITGLSLTILVSRGIGMGLNEIIASSEAIAKGDFSRKAKVHSLDEIGILGRSFNDMTGKLEDNITALKRSEEELSKAKDQAEQSAIIKEHFLANMSHEIRTPMNAVMGFTNLLENTELDEQQKEFIGAIKVAGNNLLAIINDILDYSKIASGMIILEQIPFRITSVFQSLNVLMKHKAMEKSIVLTFTAEANVSDSLMGDPTRLMQILSNLVDNALKFTEKGYVSVNARLVTEDDDTETIEFNVKDSGSGIAQDKLSVIFDRFTQASAETTRKYGGTGLGLSIVKSLVELQKGKTTVTSEPGKGSVFAFSIKYAKAKNIAGIIEDAPKPSYETGETTLQILLAEDNPLNQMLVMHFSKNHGFETEVADNGRIAVEKMRAKKYDLVLMDMQMPEMDGYEATTIIRTELKSKVPIIALTAHAMNGEKEKCLNLGMNDFVTKPFDPKDLYSKITSYFN